jgi:hypothetical protein
MLGLFSIIGHTLYESAIFIYIPRHYLSECKQFNLEAMLISTAWTFTIGVMILVVTTLVAAHRMRPLSRRRK